VTAFDMTESITPNSDQLDACDLLSGPRTFTIERISKGNAEQPFNLHLAEFPRPWRPGKSMRRVLVSAWGRDAAEYVGRRITLYCDPEVIFGGLAVGGTRIKAMSHIDKPQKVPLLVSRGKSAVFVVQPLTEPPRPAQPASTPIPDHTATLIAAMATAGLTEKATALAYLSQTVGPRHPGVQRVDGRRGRDGRARVAERAG
jgi:hypothetical protein